jgi:hypothetical protein
VKDIKKIKGQQIADVTPIKGVAGHGKIFKIAYDFLSREEPE